MNETPFFPTNLGLILKKLRERKIYQSQVEAETGIAKSTLFRWRKGERDVSRTLLIHLVGFANRHLKLKLTSEVLTDIDLREHYDEYKYQGEDLDDWIKLLQDMTEDERRDLKKFVETMLKRA